MKEKCCTECGACLTKGKTCQSIYHEFLALELTDPGYGQVHFLTVACYMIQHNGYSDDALVWIESKLRTYLENNLTGPEIRTLAAKDIEGRTWKIKRHENEQQLPKVSWSMTIADVEKEMHDTESYCELITEWGKRTLIDMGPLIERVNP
ncbi:DUF5946 family protein [Thalassobacillus sp. CUG 92003]|uniref:DUF5946 family protein n=1 Tax=Thalassobacillus sp. CUG 92003 TaxID=2736641 RepID=UPI0015E73360|nr:DUF5946 family protein [Thalassobacillus sp. CUG 92003]